MIVEISKIDVERYPELAWFMSRRESDLFHAFEPAPGIFIAESPKVIERALGQYEVLAVLAAREDLAADSSDGRLLRRLLGSGAEDKIGQMIPEGVNVYAAPRAELSRLSGFIYSRGALAAMRRKEAAGADSFYQKILGGTDKRHRIAVLCEVVNPTNTGAIFRSAAALGIEGILLSPDCCDPLYRRAIRVSMGTVFQIPWAFDPDFSWEDGKNAGLEKLKAYGFRTASMALKTDTVPIDDPALKAEERLAIVLGNEGSGLPDRMVEASDYTVMIPMAAGVDSLNVAAASALAFWELGRK